MRRIVGRVAAAAAIAASGLLAGAGPTFAQGQAVNKQHHALSLVGEPRFGPDFKHFDWVNPDAPKGGVVRLWAQGTFDSLNPFSIRGQPAVGVDVLSYSSLMMDSPDEPSTEYCLICEWVPTPTISPPPPSTSGTVPASTTASRSRPRMSSSRSTR